MTYFLLIATVVLGGVLANVLPQNSNKVLWRRRIIPFSGSFLLGIVILHILPEIFSVEKEEIGLFILIGFAIQVVLDIFSKGIEHGHLHLDGSSIQKQVIPILVALSVHSFLEGLPLGHDHVHGAADHDHMAYFWAVVFHKLPAAFTLATLLFMGFKKKSVAWMYLLFFGLMTPLAAFVANFMEISHDQHIVILALVAGSLLHVSTTIIFEIDSKGSHQISPDRLVAIILGLVLAYIAS